MNILITGGAGYLGAVASLHCIQAGHRVRVLDDLLFGPVGVAGLAGNDHFEFVRSNVLDTTRLKHALHSVEAIVHLAAIVGDPACAQDPRLARLVNVDGSKLVIETAIAAGVERFIFASTCSNYGRMADSSILATETHELRPVSLYAETKVEIERHLLNLKMQSLAPTVLRFATLYGIAPRMRYDLTVNEFVMRMMVERRLTVFGEHFWRPYVHVRDAARAILHVLEQPVATVGGRVFNVGSTDENYTKAHLVQMIQQKVGEVQVDSVPKAEDPRDYRVSFQRIRTELGFVPSRRVIDGIQEIISGIETGLLDDFGHWTRSNSRPAAVSAAI